MAFSSMTFRMNVPRKVYGQLEQGAAIEALL